MSELILLCLPDEIGAARRCGLRIACAAWRLGSDGRLWRLPLPPLPQGSLMAVFGGNCGVSAAIKADIEAERRRLNAAQVLYFPEAGHECGESGLLRIPLSTAISGGSLAQRFARGSAAFIEPCREYFRLPCRSGSGEEISAERLEKLRVAACCCGFSPELGCKYMFFESGAVLYDDAETVRHKVKLLEKLGAESIVLPYSYACVREFLRLRSQE